MPINIRHDDIKSSAEGTNVEDSMMKINRKLNVVGYFVTFGAP